MLGAQPQGMPDMASMMRTIGPQMMSMGQGQQQPQQPLGQLPVAGQGRQMPGMQGYLAQGGGIAPRAIVGRR